MISTTGFEAVIHDKLAADADLSALISNRIYPDEAPQGVTVPYVVYFDSFSDDLVTTDNQPGTLGERTIQYSVFAKTAINAKQIAEQLRRSISGFHGDLGSPAIRVAVTAFRRQTGFREEDTRLFHLPCEIDVIHKQG